MTFFYIFFIFCNFSYEIYKFKSPTFFLYIISICIFTDIGGYVFGKIIGGKKLSKISPNKTISGSFGSFIFSIIPLLLFLNFSYLELEYNSYFIIFSLLISLISQVGDLFISFLKRKAKIKDTGKILPGHGGFLDRMDGIIFALPFSYFLLKLF
ncbi:phosphatidate cytidylyltransferase [Candidatus Pelagibacter bacterium]|nr:phosphatidate cytidylyltransferase [Candidatus Pelagibacter bacterium]